MEIITPELKFIADDIKTKSTPPSMMSQVPSMLNEKGGFASMVIKDEIGKRSLSGYSNVKHSDIYSENSDGSYTAKYDSYDISGGNQEEYFAQKQTTGEKWTNGTIKLLGKTAVATLGGTLGVVDSLVEGIYKGSLSEAYGTNFNKWLDGLHTQMDYKFANYYTEQDREASLLGQMGQANFWADKVFGGISFTAGTLVSEGIWGAATGGASLLSSSGRMAKLANWTAKGLGGEGKLMKALNTAKATSRGSVDNMLEGIVANEGNLLKGISEGTKTIGTNYYKTKKLGEIALVATRSAGFESGMEARQYMNSTEHAWREKYNAVNGKEPSLAEYSQFKEGLTNSANAVFGANMAIVGGSNVAQFGSALLGRSTNPALGNSLVKRTLFGVGFDKTIEKTGKITYTALEASKKQIIAGRIWGVLGSAVTESQEEMGQKVVSLTAENYMLGGLDPKHIKTTYGMAEAFTDALHNTYGTKEGWSEGLVGAIVGVFGAGVHSKFKFGEVTAERKNVEDVVTYANGFTAENHFNNLVANSKILQAQEDKEGAISRGDIVGEQLADTASSIAFIERNQAIGNTKEAVNDLALQMDAISNEALAEELGLGKGEEAKQQAKEFKAQKIAEFKSLAETHEKNLNYAEALFGETEIAGVDKDSTRALIRAVATTITMGDKSMKINQGLVSHVRALVADSVDLEGVTDAMSVQQILDLAPREKTLKLLQLNREHLTLDAQEKELRNKEFEASKLKDTEDNKVRTNTLTDLAKQLQDLQTKREEIREQKRLALDAIGVKTYTDENVTVEMFDAQNENLTKLKNTLDHIRKTNPERYSEIKKGLEAQSKAVAHIKGYQKTIEMISDPKSRTTVLNGWLKKLLKGKTKLSEGMTAYVTDVLTNQEKTDKVVFQDSTDITERANFRKGLEVSDEYKQQVGKARRAGEKLSKTDSEIYEKYKVEIEKNAKETIEVPQKETEKAEVSNLEKLKNKVREIISSNDYLTGYFGKDLTEQGKSKPSEKDIKRYEELLSKIDRRVESNISKIVSYPENYYDGQLGLKNAEIDELVKLQTVLNDWLTLEGALDKDNQSVAQLLDLISSLESVKANENVLKDVTTEDYKSVLGSKSEEESNTNTNSVRGLQTPTEALVTVKGGNMRISHLRTETLESFFPGSNLTKNVDGSFEIALASGKTLKGQENDKGGQDIDLEDWNAVEAESNVLIKNFGTKPSAISQAVPSNTTVEQTSQISYLLNTPSSQIIEELNKLKTTQEKLNWLKEQNLLEPILVNGVSYDLVDYNGRNVVLMKIGGINIPFYISTGQAGKKTVKVGNWYAVFGIGVEAGWINKGTEEQINTQYGYPVLQKIAKILNEGVGNIENREDNGNGRLKDGIGFLEDDIQTLNSFNSQMNLTTQPAGKNTDIDGFNKHVFATLTSINEELLFATQNKANSELFQNVASDFDFQQTDGTSMKIDKDAVNNVKNGDTLELHVSTTDVFNSKLEKGERAKQLHIYVMKGGKLLGSLPASNKTAVEGIGVNLVDLRKEAYDFWQADKTGKTLIKLPHQMKAQITFMGVPNLTLHRSEEGTVETKTLPFTGKSLQHVVGQGYILDGVVTTTAKIDVNQFTRTISKGNPGVKVPFIVFNYKGKNVSFPVKLNTKTSNKAENALNGENSLEKAKSLVNTLLQNNMKDVADSIDFTDPNWMDSKEVEEAMIELSKVEETISIETFASSTYSKERLRGDAEIAIDLENRPFGTNKVMLTTTDELAPDVLGYRELILEKEEKISQVKNELSDLARQVEVAQLNDSDLDNNLTDVFADNPTVKGDVEGNITILRNALKGISRKTSKLLGVDLINLAKSKLKELDSLESMVKNVSEQIKNSKYYRDVDPSLLVLDESGEIENPAITQEAIIEQLGGIKDFEEFEEKAQGIETLNKSGQYLLDLFEETKDLERVEVKVETQNGLEDKLDTSVRDTLVATMRDSSNGLLELVQVLNSYSPQVLKANPKEVEKLLKEIEDKALDHNIDFRGLSGILEILPLLQRVLSPNANEEDFNSFVEAYLKGKGAVESPKQKVIKVAPQFKGKKLIVLESESSQYKLFKDEGLIEVQEGVYLKTDGHEQTLEEVEAKLDQPNVDPQLQDVITEDAEYDLDTVKKFIHYKNHFVAPNIEGKDPTPQLKKVGGATLKPKKSVIPNYFNKQLRGEHKALENLVFDSKGITLRHLDKQSVDVMNDYLKGESELRNYFLLSVNTNFEVYSDEVAQVSMRDVLYNGGRLEQFKGDSTPLGKGDIRANTVSNFITLGNDNFERISGDLFAKIGKNESEFLEVGVEQPKLSIDPAQYTSQPIADSGVVTHNNYTNEGGFITEEKNTCSS